MKCPKCGMQMEKGLWVLKGGIQNIGRFNIGLYWCKKYGIFKVIDKIDIINNVSGRKIAYICKKCRITSSNY